MGSGIKIQPLLPIFKNKNWAWPLGHSLQGSETVECPQKGMRVLRQAIGQRACVEAGLWTSQQTWDRVFACALLSAEYSSDWQSLTHATKQSSCFLLHHSQSRMNVFAWAVRALPNECSFVQFVCLNAVLWLLCALGCSLLKSHWSLYSLSSSLEFT